MRSLLLVAVVVLIACCLFSDQLFPRLLGKPGGVTRQVSPSPTEAAGGAVDAVAVSLWEAGSPEGFRRQLALAAHLAGQSTAQQASRRSQWVEMSVVETLRWWSPQITVAVQRGDSPALPVALPAVTGPRLPVQAKADDLSDLQAIMVGEPLTTIEGSAAPAGGGAIQRNPFAGN